MKFTDEDLKRLKEEMANGMNWPDQHIRWVEALIARLEAAERLISLSGTHIPVATITRERETAVWAWRKSAGK